jgi:RNA polymerase sigma factor (sigma-70 family)
VAVEDLLRELAPQVLGVLTRRYGDFDAAEDAVQEALLAAAVQWSRDGIPEHPRGWLIQTGTRRLIDQRRSERARVAREDRAALAEPPTPDVPGRDDTLVVLFLCCHPSLTPASAIALTLRAVGGLSTAEIARAFLVPEPTMGQRISRAKQKITSSGVPFRLPTAEERAERLRTVLHVLYLIFNEGYAATGGRDLHRADLSDEAIRLTRLVHRMLPDDPEVAGLLALMLLLDARRPARTGRDGELVPLPEQDRTRWDRELITEGGTLLAGAIGRGAVGEYQLQASIAAVHDQAARAEDTDWPRILTLYELLDRMVGNPVVTLNRAVAAAMVHGPDAGLALLAEVEDRLPGQHRVDAVRAHLLEMSGKPRAAAEHYAAAADRATNLAERRHLAQQAARLKSRFPE